MFVCLFVCVKVCVHKHADAHPSSVDFAEVMTVRAFDPTVVMADFPIAVTYTHTHCKHTPHAHQRLNIL